MRNKLNKQPWILYDDAHTSRNGSHKSFANLGIPCKNNFQRQSQGQPNHSISFKSIVVY